MCQHGVYSAVKVDCVFSALFSKTGPIIVAQTLQDLTRAAFIGT